MDEENYKLLLENNKKLEDRITALEGRLTEVTAFNRALLSSKEPTSNQVSKEEHLKQIDEKIKKGLKH